MGYTYYNPLKVWLDPASIADVVAHIQAYLVEYPLINQSDIEQIVVDYITAHPELVGGVDSVNGKTGEVVLTASDINTSNNTTIQAVLNALSGQISEIVQTITGLDTRVTTNATGITNEATARANADTALGNRITALQGAVGSPLVAATAAAMTDITKIYVYTGSESGYTNGNWYYYNGSAWTSGGVYNATAINTDTTLTVAGMAADAKATGDGLNDLKSSLDEITGGTRNIAYLEQGTLNISNGAEQDSTTRCRTNFIPIDTTTNLYITRGLWSVRNGIGYDANKQFVASNQFLSDAYADEGRPFSVNNANIKYVRFIYSASNTSQNVTPDYGPFMVEVGEKTGYYVPFDTAVDYEARAQIAEIKATPPNHLEMLCEGFDHVAVIGDSLITGTTLNASAVAKSDLNWSWVKRLAVRSGNDWTPYGRAGLTLQTWLTDSAGLPALQNGTTPDVIIVSLGTNDAVGDNYISAFTTNYGTLLDTLHTNFPNALILCLPLWNFAASRTLEYQNTSAAIQTVCESRNFAFFVSMVTYDATLKNDYFTQSRISAHYNSLAYAWISDIIAFCIGEVIESNPTAFNYINFING